MSVAANKLPVKPKLEANFRATGFWWMVMVILLPMPMLYTGARNIIVENKKGDQFFAKALYVNKITDLAILKISDTSFKKVNNLPYTFPNLLLNLANIFLRWVIHVKKLYMAKDILVQNRGILVIPLLTRSVFQLIRETAAALLLIKMEKSLASSAVKKPMPMVWYLP